MRKTILAAAVLACLAASFGTPAPIEAATSGTVAKEGPDGGFTPCSCACIPWFNGKQLCVCICG